MAEGFIPARKAELIAALAAEGGLAESVGARFTALARLLAALLHHRAHDELERLKALYAPLDPDAPPARRGAGEAPVNTFLEALTETLARANFTAIEAGVESQGRTRLTADLRLKASDAGIRTIRYFARGGHDESVSLKSLFGLLKKDVQAEILDDVVVLVAFKDEGEIQRKDRKAFRDMRRGIRPGAVIVKHFRHVARAELITLHPGATPTMRPRDQVIMAAPAIAGGLPLLLQLGPAITVLFAVLAAYFGMGGVIDNNRLQQALAAMSGLVAVGAFVLRQKMKYERQTLLYQKQLADTVYFRNVANNAGVLDALIGAGEEQDAKEALLAYWALLKYNAAMTKAEIDKAAEAFLRAHFAMNVDFEIGDALGKLERLGLVERTGEAYAAIGIDAALAKLDAAWDALFAHAPASQ